MGVDVTVRPEEPKPNEIPFSTDLDEGLYATGNEGEYILVVPSPTLKTAQFYYLYVGDHRKGVLEPLNLSVWEDDCSVTKIADSFNLIVTY